MSMTQAHEQVIYHMAPLAAWEAQRDQPVFIAASLAAEGFIHCTAEPEKLLQVANRFYHRIPGPFIIACIAPERLHAEVRWEMADGHRFPHIYGPLDRDAVIQVLTFPRAADQQFELPPELKE